MPLEPKIIDINESSRLNARGELVRTMRVTYQIGSYGPFTSDIPQDEFTREKVDQIIQERQRTIQDVVERYGG